MTQPPPSKSATPYNVQRLSMGILAVICLIVGGYLFWEDNESRVFLCGLFVRVGLLMSVIWLAWNQLFLIPRDFNPLALGGFIAILFLAASRPRLFPIVAAILVISLFANAVIRRFTGIR